MGEIADGDGRLLRYLLAARGEISKQSAITTLRRLLEENHTPEDYACAASLFLEPSQ